MFTGTSARLFSGTLQVFVWGLWDLVKMLGHWLRLRKKRCTSPLVFFNPNEAAFYQVTGCNWVTPPRAGLMQQKTPKLARSNPPAKRGKKQNWAGAETELVEYNEPEAERTQTSPHLVVEQIGDLLVNFMLFVPFFSWGSGGGGDRRFPRLRSKNG